jgi:hypothetical protein
MAEETSQKWYNSSFFSNLSEGIGIVATIACLTVGVGYCNRSRGPTENAVELEKAKHGYLPQKEDINGNGNADVVYNIDGQICVAKIDGQSITDYLHDILYK